MMNRGRPSSDLGLAGVAQQGLLALREARALRTRGLPEPVRDLRASLSTRIGVLGLEDRGIVANGRWHFEPDSIIPLNERWAFARFGNGTIAGSCLLGYEVRSGRVRWRLLELEIDEPGEQ
ncbi:MAG: hypothetical protein ACREOU_10800 [Candidatus Eiseniibacteriota bacterium]